MMKRPTSLGCFAIACCALALVPSAATAQTVTLDAVKDNTLIEVATGDLSLGASFALFAGRVGASGGGTIRRAAVAFDIGSAVPPGSIVTDVTFKLFLMQPNNGPQLIKVYGMTADWGEGTSSFGGGSGAPATPNDATWLHRFYPTIFWNQPGGDYDGTLLASKTVSGAGFYTWNDPALTAAVQQWVNSPEMSFGFCIKGNEAQMQTAKKFASSEWTSPIQPTPPEVLAQRPKLIITYTPNYAPADFNQDGNVDGFDLAVLLAVWGPCDPCPADLNDDGIINGLDLALLLGQWG